MYVVVCMQPANADVFLVVPFLHPEVRKATTGNTFSLAGYGVRTWELFLCLAPAVFVFFFGSTILTSLFSLFYVTREFYRFLHRG